MISNNNPKIESQQSSKKQQKHQNQELDIFQLQHYINKYQNLLSCILKEKQSQQNNNAYQLFNKLFDKSFSQEQYQSYLKQIKEKFQQIFNQLQESYKKIIFVSEMFIQKQQQHKNNKINSESVIHQNQVLIDSQKQQIIYLKDKLKISEDHVQKLTADLIDFQQKVGQVDTYFEKQRIKLEHLLQVQKKDQEKQGQQILNQLKESHLKLSNMLNLTKRQKSQQQVIVSQLQAKIQDLQSQLTNLSGKYEWQISKKESLEKQLQQRLQMIDQMQEQINDLRDVLRNPFERLSHQASQQQLQLVDDEIREQNKTKPVVNTSQIDGQIRNFSQDVEQYGIQEINMDDIRGSFIHKLDQMGIKLDSSHKQIQNYDQNAFQEKRFSMEKADSFNNQKNMKRVSQDSAQNKQKQKQKQKQRSKLRTKISFKQINRKSKDVQKQQQYLNHLSNQNQNKDNTNRNSKDCSNNNKIVNIKSQSFFESHKNQINPNSNLNAEQNYKRKVRHFKSFGEEINNQIKPSPNIENNNTNNTHIGYKRKFQQNVNSISINKSQLKTKMTQYKKIPIQLDPYYSHFILTSQAVKIRQDCQDLLNIDVKPFYKEILDKRIPMHLWDQWIRNKLRQILKESRQKM